ncbi:MAG: L-threonylcarbamoyladenylate synthase [Henriciella sp.]|nr:L-threonylcarbamoyladenylate synthase [Henriciella sp.]
MTASILPPTPDAIARAVSILRDGGLVVMPTETVYGLAADASNAIAVAKLYEAKERPRFNPLIAHVASFDQAQTEGVFNPKAIALARAFWPGPLTLVVDVNPDGNVCSLARAGLQTLALRVPAHPVAHSLLQAFDGPLAAPSANPSGQMSPTEAMHVQADMGDRVDLILDGGPCNIGLESTIIDVRADTPTLLRYGAITQAQIEAIWPGVRLSDGNPEAPSAPGQLLRHYAPKARLHLNREQANPGGSLLGFGAVDGTLNLSPQGELIEAAANLFSMLRQLDAQFEDISVAPIPETGLGLAINDRLRRAAADR